MHGSMKLILEFFLRILSIFHGYSRRMGFFLMASMDFFRFILWVSGFFLMDFYRDGLENSHEFFGFPWIYIGFE